MWHLVLPRFLLRGDIDSDEHGLLYGPGDAMGLPIYYGEAVKFDGMTFGVGMTINRGGRGVAGHTGSPSTVILPYFTPPSQPHLGPLQQGAHKHHLVSMVLPGVPPLPTSTLAPNFPTIFRHQISKYKFFPQT